MNYSLEKELEELDLKWSFKIFFFFLIPGPSS